MKFSKLLLAMAASGIATSAFATNGYFSHGYGMTAKGMAGAATAMTKDAFGGANNPATMVWVGNRYDVGADAFSPIREASRAGGTGTFDPGSGAVATTQFMPNQASGSDNELFGVPEFGYNKMLNDRMSVGVTVYGNGGMNTDYATQSGTAYIGGSNINLLGGTTSLGVDLTQLIIAPTVSYKISSTASVGVSPLLGYQRFSASGLELFNAFGYSSSSAHLTNNGMDDATGFGARVGIFAKVNDALSVGAAYSSKVDMSKFDKYKGLFAEQGNFDLPANWNVGVSYSVNPRFVVALDYQHIDYSGIKAISNISTTVGTGTLGTDSGPGFGWSDMDIIKLGVEYKYAPNMIIRAGYSHGDSPIQGRDVSFNILAPAVIEDHVTFGLTYSFDKDSELTVSYAHAIENSLTDRSLYTALGYGTFGNDTIKMHQNSIGIAYSKKF